MVTMRIDRDRLRWLALATLAEQVELAHAAAPAPSHGVRLALAVLFTLSRGEREPFDAFWQQMRNGENQVHSDQIASYSRTTHLTTKLRGVMRAVGIDPSVATEEPLFHAALKVYPRATTRQTPPERAPLDQRS